MQDSTKKTMNNCTEEKDGLNKRACLRSALVGAVGAKVTECNALCLNIFSPTDINIQKRVKL